MTRRPFRPHPASGRHRLAGTTILALVASALIAAPGTPLAGPAGAEVPVTGTITEFAAPTLTAAAQLVGITSGPDGNLWFTEYGGNKIGKVTTTGTITEYSIPTSSTQPVGIAAGPDGNLWFTESVSGKIGKITAAGTITEYALPSTSSDPQGIAAGPDGNLWFTEYGGNKVGTLALANTGVQQMSLTVNGVLTIALSQTSVPLGSAVASQNTSPVSVGSITYTNTLGDGSPWSATVAATDLVAGSGNIAASSLTYTPSTVTAGTGATGTAPTAGAAGAFSFAGCNGVGDLLAGVSYSCPLSLLTAGSTTQGGWVQSSNTVKVTVPTGTPNGSYSGSLQYSVTG